MAIKKIKDPIILGIVSGLIGNCAKLAGNLFNRYVLKRSDTTYPEIAAGMFMTKKERNKPIGMLVGGLADFGLGGILGIPMVYLLRYTGRDKAGIKGLGLGHFAWIAVYGAIGRGFGTKRGVFPLDAHTNLSAFVNHSWYGLITSLVAAKLGDPSLFPEPASLPDQTGNLMLQKNTRRRLSPVGKHAKLKSLGQR